MSTIGLMTTGSLLILVRARSVRILLECFLVTGRNEVVAKVIFLQVSVCPQGGGGCLPQCMLGCHTPPPRMEEPPQMEEPPRMENPPGWRNPPGKADSSIRSTSGRYASYWNAFLFCKIFAKNCMKIKEFGLRGRASLAHSLDSPLKWSKIDLNKCVY